MLERPDLTEAKHAAPDGADTGTDRGVFRTRVGGEEVDLPVETRTRGGRHAARMNGAQVMVGRTAGGEPVLGIGRAEGPRRRFSADPDIISTQQIKPVDPDKTVLIPRVTDVTDPLPQRVRVTFPGRRTKRSA